MAGAWPPRGALEGAAPPRLGFLSRGPRFPGCPDVSLRNPGIPAGEPNPRDPGDPARMNLLVLPRLTREKPRAGGGEALRAVFF